VSLKNFTVPVITSDMGVPFAGSKISHLPTHNA